MLFNLFPTKLYADNNSNINKDKEEEIDFSKYSQINNINYTISNKTPKEFPNSVEYYQKQKLLEKQAKENEALIVKYLFRKPNPVSILPENYTYSHPNAIPFNQPLSKEEADRFYSYEDYIRNWYLTPGFFNMSPFQVPYNPMASPWNWDRSINYAGIISFLCASTDMFIRPNPQLFLKRSVACLSYPLFSYLVQYPEHRSRAMVSFGIFTILPIAHCFSSSWEYRHLPARFFTAACINFVVGSYYMGFAINSYFKNERVRVYNPKLLEDYYNLLSSAKPSVSDNKN